MTHGEALPRPVVDVARDQGLSVDDLDDLTDLAVAVERHLLEARLAPAQRETLRRWGWFDLPWPEQVLVLRVSATRSPAVEAYQPVPPGARPGAPGAPPGVHLCSWDLRALHARRPSRAPRPLRYRCSRAAPRPGPGWCSRPTGGGCSRTSWKGRCRPHGFDWPGRRRRRPKRAAILLGAIGAIEALAAVGVTGRVSPRSAARPRPCAPPGWCGSP